MSVSEGIKKYNSKNYNVLLKSLSTEEVIGDHKKGVKIQPWTTVNEIKTKVGKHYGVSNKNIRLFYCNIEMIDELTMLDYKLIDVKKPEIYFQITSPQDSAINIQVYGAFRCPDILRELIEEVRHGLMEGLAPTLILEGTSGTYHLRNTNKDTVGLFKPIDEEAFAPNNQKGYTGKFGQESFRKGILSGEGCIREVAAYLLDKKNFFGVPETTFIEISHPTFNKNLNDLLSIDDQSLPKMRNSIIHNFVLENLVSPESLINLTKEKKRMGTITSTDSTNNDNSINSSSSQVSKPISNYLNIKKKYGSFQRFIKANDVAANFSSSLFETKDVHKLGVLDIRILNCDRNDENILVIKKKDKNTGKGYYKLVPIDHSLSFPDCIKIQEYEMCWMSWDQAHVPFNKEMLDYIKKIDILADMHRMSESIKLRDKCWKNFRIANIVLKIGAENGLTLYEIGMLLYKPGFNEEVPSEVEKLIEKTEKLSSLYNVHTELLTQIKNEEDDIRELQVKEYNELKHNYKTESMIEIHHVSLSDTKLIEEDPDHEDITKSKSLNTNNFDQDHLNNHRRKKNSLLKRTASEPKLAKIDSYNENNFIIDGKEKYDEKIDYDLQKKSFTINTQIEDKNQKKTYKDKMYITKLTQSKDEPSEDLDSPYNKIFFYNFENVLIDYIKKIKIK